MRTAVFSDVHGNLHALNSILESVRTHAAERMICLGDIVGYGAHPSECIQLIRQNCEIVLAGNHDWGVSGRDSLAWFNPLAKEAALWSRQQLSREELDWLANLPLDHREQDVYYVHAAPGNPEHWEYIDSLSSAARALERTDASIVFVGHSHTSDIYRSGEKMLVNVGSTGQPRDGDPRARWCLFEEESHEVEMVAVPYDMEGAKKAILDAGLPAMLAYRLGGGF